MRRSRPPSSTTVTPTLPTAALLLGLLAAGCAAGGGQDDAGSAGDGAAPGAEAALPVAVSLPPQAWLVDRLGGERVRSTVLLPPGRSHHAFEPAPREIRALAEARLYLAVGHPELRFERLLLAALPEADRPETLRLVEAAGLPTDRSTDPHLWLDPAVMRAGARTTAAALARLDPEGAEAFDVSLAAVLDEIDAAEDAVEAVLSPLRGRSVLVYHPAWGPLLRPFGIREQAIEHEGKPPSPRRLAGQVEGARGQRAAAVFVQPGLPDHAARALAGEIGAELVELDPLAYDWPVNLRRAADAFAAGAFDSPGTAEPGSAHVHAHAETER